MQDSFETIMESDNVEVDLETLDLLPCKELT